MIDNRPHKTWRFLLYWLRNKYWSSPSLTGYSPGYALEFSKEYGWDYGDTPTIVLTNRPLLTERQNIEFYSGELNQFVTERLERNYENVWILGGSMVTKDFIHRKSVDKTRVSILPIILGDVLLFFDNIR